MVRSVGTVVAVLSPAIMARYALSDFQGMQAIALGTGRVQVGALREPFCPARLDERHLGRQPLLASKPAHRDRPFRWERRCCCLRHAG